MSKKEMKMARSAKLNNKRKSRVKMSRRKAKRREKKGYPTNMSPNIPTSQKLITRFVS